MKRICCLLLCLLLICGCAPAEPREADAPVPADTAAQSEAPEAAESLPSDGTPVNDGEPEGWEEEWPEEYAVENYRLEDGAIAQTGELRRYRYSAFYDASLYMETVANYVEPLLGGSLSIEEDSAHDGYSNTFILGIGGTASVSGSSITGRFSYHLSLDFDRILEKTETAVMDEAAMERAAREFAARFDGITGELELLKAVKQEADYHDPRSDEPRYVSVPVMVYTFRSAENSSLTLDMQDGQPVPARCGDSTNDDLNVHCFTVTVWPDGTVAEADNYITRGEVTDNGTARMLTEDDLPMLLDLLTSPTQHDTVVFESIRADCFDVYFGSANIEPTVTVEYHFESDPDERHTTQFVLPGLLDPE